MSTSNACHVCMYVDGFGYTDMGRDGMGWHGMDMPVISAGKVTNCY